MSFGIENAPGSASIVLESRSSNFETARYLSRLR